MDMKIEKYIYKESLKTKMSKMFVAFVPND